MIVGRFISFESEYSERFVQNGNAFESKTMEKHECGEASIRSGEWGAGEGVGGKGGQGGVCRGEHLTEPTDYHISLITLPR